MTVRTKLLLPFLAILIWSAGCQQDVPEVTSDESAMETPPDPGATRVVKLLGLTGSVPDSWVAESPSSSMRLLQFRVPGHVPEGDAEFVVFYFGPGQGGTPATNIARWRSQFISEAGEPVEPEISSLSADGMPITFVSLTGNYARGIGMGSTTHTPGQTLLAAIVESPRGNLFAQLHGPSETVMRVRESFLGFATGLAIDGGSP